MGSRLISTLAAGCLAVMTTLASANTVILVPGDVPDEQTPRIAGDAPTPQFGSDSWQNSTTGKVNVYVTPQQLFGHGITINDIASISYYTKAPSGHENWYLNIYTQGPGDASWYGKRFFNSDYTSYASDGAWHNNVLDSIQRNSGVGGPTQTLAGWKSTYGSENVRFFSPQTNSGIPSGQRDAQIDGLVVTLITNEVGSVNFAAVAPLPTAAGAGLALISGFGLFGRSRNRQQQA